MVGDVVYLDARAIRAKRRRVGSIATVTEILDIFPGWLFVEWLEYAEALPDNDINAYDLNLIKRKD